MGGPLLLRRLTEAQYRATIAEIFGPDAPIVARFERGFRAEGLLAIGTSEAGISPFSIEQYSRAALSIADYVMQPDHRDRYLDCAALADGRFNSDCADQFIRHYGELLFRRPLTAAQRQRMLTIAQSGAEQLGDFDQGLKFALVGLLSSPEFLLRLERVKDNSKTITELDDYSKAERLAFFLTNAGPDQQLLEAAAGGELNSRQGLVKSVDRLLAGPQLEGAVRAFFSDMLQFDRFADVSKDADIYPAYSSQVAIDAQEQTLRDIVWLLVDQRGDYRDLFTLKQTHLTRALGIVYRQPVATRNGWQLTEFPETGVRAGIQSHIAFLALHAHPGRSSPTLRGKAIREIFLCQDVPDPPANVNFSLVQDDHNAAMPTARDRLVAHRTQPSCAGCHKIMDPPGLGLEQFDGLGTYRWRENGAVIDAGGDLDGLPYDDAAGLAQALHNHRETPRCLAENLYHYAVGRDTVWAERDYMDYLIAAFAKSGYRVDQLMRTIALSDNFFAIKTTGSDSNAAPTTALKPSAEPATMASDLPTPATGGSS